MVSQRVTPFSISSIRSSIVDVLNAEIANAALFLASGPLSLREPDKVLISRQTTQAMLTANSSLLTGGLRRLDL
jgi:hypothetical protein